MTTQIVLDALQTAVAQRDPKGVVHDSDQGRPVHIDRVRQALPGSWRPTLIGPVGDCYDNAMCESFFATLECELLDRSRLSREQAESAVFDFIEGVYSTRRRHSATGDLALVECERQNAANESVSDGPTPPPRSSRFKGEEEHPGARASGAH